MVTRRQGLIGLFSTLGLGAVGGAAYFLTRPEEIIPPIPMPADRRPRIGVQYAVINADTGELILGQYEGLRREPASLTKMMTLAVVFKAMNDPNTRFNLSSKVTIPEYIDRVRGDLAVFEDLDPGEQYDARDLLTGAGSRSDAFSTIALALHVGSPSVYNWEGTEAEKAERFLGEMNKLAAEIGMADSHFSVITGSPNRENLSTPADIAKLISYIDRTYPSLAEITFGQPTFDIRPASASTIHSSSLLRSRPGEIEFAKTGFTNLAGRCLGVKALVGDHSLIGVVFGADSDAERNKVMRTILTEAAAALTPTQIVQAANPVPTPP